MIDSVAEVIKESSTLKKMKQYFHINDDYYVLRYFQNMGLNNQSSSSEQ
jgi:hypothetical protein